jgi:phosphoribosylglycinamide formyltransferase-1
VHFVTPEVDAGPIIAQAAVPVLAGRHARRLAARCPAPGTPRFPLAVRWLAEGRVRLGEDGTAAVIGVAAATRTTRRWFLPTARSP